ncbi:MAG: UPF0182 family membrane protein [Acidimicrobiia bacterium]
MRVPPVERRRRGGFRIRGWMIAIVVVLVVLFLSARGLAGFYTDYLWFDSVGFGSTWRALLWARFAPTAVFTVLFFVLMLVSLTVADRLAPRTRTMGPEDELLARYQQSVGPYSGRIRIAVAAFFALVTGGSVTGKWQQWVLFTNAKSFHIKDPQFHKDVGFYVFRLPFLTFLFDWLFAALIIILIVTAVAHYLNGGIRLQSPFQRVTPQVKAHLSVILALMALVKTAQYYYARFSLNFSTRGVVEGASKTDVAAQLPALNLLMVISVVAAALFVWNIWRRGWVLPIIAVGLWAFVSLVIGTIVPVVYQQFVVQPNELQKETPYIQRNIHATREAFGLDQVAVESFPYRQNLTAQSIQDNATTIDNARLWDPPVILRSFQLFQALQTFYKFADVDVDRYVIDNKLRQTLIGARELNPADLPSQTWVNRHLVYTHGYGSVVSPSNSANTDGQPNYLLSDIPPQGDIPLDRPEVYFGENLAGFSLVDAKTKEFNYPKKGASNAFTRYTGSGGVELSSWLRRAAFALRFNDFNILISGQVTPKTKVLYLRDIADRVKKAAPFLHYDGDPYAVIANGHLVWMLDGYTTSDKYPYSQSFDGSGGLNGSFNYVRNSVKATIDAYNGDIKLYVVDQKDPVIQAYRSAFPQLFTDFSKMPAAIKAHLRFPQDLFRSQTDVYRTYHMINPTTFYNKADLWEVSPDPGSGPVEAPAAVDVPTTAPKTPQAASSTGARIEPIYLLIKLPGETQEQFVILRPFVPVSKGNALQNLVSFMVAKSEPSQYGKLQSFTMPTGNNTVYGPVQVNSTILNTDQISSQFTLLNQQGSSVVQGSLQLIPIEDSLIYIRPIYVVSASQKQPAFRFVVVFYAGKAVLATTVQKALAQFPAFNGLGGGETTPTTPGGTGTTPTPTPSQDVASLLRQAAKAYADAQTALKNGDFARYGELSKQLGDLLDQAAAAFNASPGTSTSSTSSTSTTTTTSGGSGGSQALSRHR